MMVDQLIALMIIAGLFAIIFCYIIYRFIYFRERKMENKYFLYAVRDELIQLVADGKLKEDEYLFREHYPMVNHIIDSINSFRFSEIVKAIVTQDQLSEEKWKLFIEEINKQSKDVKKVFINLNRAICLIIYRNSLLFRLLIRFSLIYLLFKRAMNHITVPVPILNDQIKAHDYYVRMNECCS